MVSIIELNGRSQIFESHMPNFVQIMHDTHKSLTHTHSLPPSLSHTRVQSLYTHVHAHAHICMHVSLSKRCFVESLGFLRKEWDVGNRECFVESLGFLRKEWDMGNGEDMRTFNITT